ncbi:MAG TPA: hypothetical protein VFE21_11345 [Rubrobacteraceae bacterium]|nr:hypothetical protein [Rubrobacteraceae bacterium]
MTYRWAAALFLVGTVAYNVTVFTPAAESMSAVGVHALVAVGLGATGVWLLSIPDADWEKVRVAAPVAEEAAPVGAQPRVQ